MNSKRQKCTMRIKAFRLLMSAALVTGLLGLMPGPVAGAADLIHQYDFNGNLNDTLGTGISLTVHLNTLSSGFGTSEWWWTANSTPGGGLILETDLLTNPQNYSLGFRIEFDQVGTGYKKIVSFEGPSADYGFYFYDSHLQFYPFGTNTAITYSANTFYDFIFSRSADDVIKVYVVEGDGTVTKVYEENDTSDASVPIQVGGKYQFMFFMDDTATSGEWTDGGTVRSIRVWNGPLEEEEIPDALSDASTDDATDITTSSATLNGTVNPKGSETTVTFEYGLTTAYGTEVTAEQSPISGATNVAVSKSISGLTANTPYHYRVKVVNAGGTTYGSDRTFTTLATPSSVTTQTFTYTGSDQTFTVPTGVTSISFEIWGAGGGMGGYMAGYSGGSGGYASGDLAVTPGVTYTIVVGQGGIGVSVGSGTEGGAATYGGGGYGTMGDASGASGGGLSGIFSGWSALTFTDTEQTRALAIAGGGGGSTSYSGGGGAGGGSEGGSTTGGNGGTQDEGGSGTDGDDGGALQGGNGDEGGSRITDNGDTDGGGGGGGYFGGEGGFGDAEPGGGGSGYLSGSVSNGTLMLGTNGPYEEDANPPVTTDSENYVSGVGVGVYGRTSSTSGSNGGDGLVVITWETGAAPDLALTKTVTPTSAEPDQAITYTITFTNTGTALASSVVITDIVPVSVTNTSVISSGVTITQTNVGVVTYTWEVQDLTADQVGVITITGQVSSSLSTGATFTNTATITTTSGESDSTDNSATAAVFVADVVEQQCGVQAGNTYTFHQASTPVTITITTLGDVDCLTIARVDSDHPDATSAIQTGAYWRIEAANSSGASATGFTVSMTIQVGFEPDSGDKICRYTGSGQVWDCAADSFDADAKTITRNNVTQFSDWAGGDDVPTAVTLQSLTTRAASPKGIPLPLLALAALGAVGLVLLRARRRR